MRFLSASRQLFSSYSSRIPTNSSMRLAMPFLPVLGAYSSIRRLDRVISSLRLFTLTDFPSTHVAPATMFSHPPENPRVRFFLEHSYTWRTP